MDIPRSNATYYSELAKNTDTLENLQHSNSFEAVIQEHRVQSEVTHVQTQAVRYDSSNLPVEFSESFFVPDNGIFTITGASLQEQVGTWNLTCRLSLNDMPYLITAQEGATQIQTPKPDGEMAARQFDGDFAKRILSGLVLSSMQDKNAGAPPKLENLKGGSEFRQIEAVLQALGELNGLTHTETLAVFESNGLIPGPSQQTQLDKMNRALYLKLAEVESMTASAVSTSIELGWQLLPDSTTRTNVSLRETAHPDSPKKEISGERQPVMGTLADYVLNKKLEGLLPHSEEGVVPQFLSPDMDKEEWAQAATTLVKTLEPLMQRYAHLDD